MRLERLIETLVECGWTKTHYPRWGDARAHRIGCWTMIGGERKLSTTSIGSGLRSHRSTERYDRELRRYVDNSWATRAKSADVWTSTPDADGIQSAITFVFGADGKVVRQIEQKGSWRARTMSIDEMAHLVRRESPQGRQEAAQLAIEHEAKQAQRKIEARDRDERYRMLMEDAKALMSEAGYDPEAIRRGQRQDEVTIDLEVILSILRGLSG